MNRAQLRKRKVFTDQELQQADLKANPTPEEKYQLELKHRNSNGLTKLTPLEEARLLRSKFKPLIGIGQVGIYVNFMNTHKVSERPVKLISYDFEDDQYRFQYLDESGEFLNISGNAYPYHTWRSEPAVVRFSLITPLI